MAEKQQVMRLAKYSLPPKSREDHAVPLPADAVVVGAGYSGGASVHLFIEVPTSTSTIEVRLFRRFGVGDVVPDDYKYVAHVQAGPDVVFVYELVKS